MKDNNKSSTARFVVGLLGMIIFGIILLFLLVAMLVLPGNNLVALPGVITMAALFILSGFLLNSGMKRKNVIRRLSRYVAELACKQNVLSIDQLSALTGFFPMQIKNDMKMLKRWDLNFDLYVDREETTLMKGKNAFDLYIDTERQREELALEEAEREKRLLDPETATLEAFKRDGAAIVEKLRAANLILPGERISASLYKLEQTTKNIFEYIDNHPDKLPETRKLMNYHLPTTIKLIDKYCQYDTMENQPQAVTDAKVDIEKALDAANEAFVNFYESLFHEDTLDVTTDAEVLTKMFEKDGLTGRKFDINNNQSTDKSE